MNYTTKCNTSSGSSCPKIGIKIHETKSQIQQPNVFAIPNTNYNPKENTNSQTAAKPVNYYNTSLSELDLDIENYSLDDLYRLFNIEDSILTEDNLKQSKTIVLKMHPDKSRLDQKYFLFFSKAYKRLFSIYEFQNKSLKKKYKDEDFYDDSRKSTLNQLFEKNKSLKDGPEFNKWFNSQFDKYKVEDEPSSAGYGDWLKSDDTPYNVNETVTKGNMNEYFERQKQVAKTLTVYNGISDPFASTFGGSLLNSDTSNFTCSEPGNLSYTDLKQAYTESVIPVTQDDFDNMQKFNTISEYKTHRDRVDITPVSKEDGERMLLRSQKKMDEDTAALAFRYAQESEKRQERDKSFWGSIQRITGL